MNSPPNNRETLQQLLANAFAVQESHIDPHSLTAIMQIQALLATGKLDVDSVMAHIVNSARHVANASGVAVALLRRDRLTYRAGTGSSESLIGLQVTASLTVSPGTKTNCEILRVENAQTDTRIEADICRQFGASALLIVPIYLDGALAGVLDVRFCEPHSFQIPEIRAYRLMAEQIEAALFHAAQFEKTQLAKMQVELNQDEQNQLVGIPNSPTELPSAPFEDQVPEDFVPLPDFMMLPENEHSFYARCGALFSDIMQLPVFRQIAWLTAAGAQRAMSLRPARPLARAESEIPDLPPQALPPEVMASQETFASSPAEELPQWESSAPALPAIPPATAHVERAARVEREVRVERVARVERALLPAPIPAWRTRTSAWRENLRSTAHEASTEFFSTFKRAAASATLLAQRARESNWPSRLRAKAQDTSSEFSSTFKRAAASASVLSQRAKNSTLPNRVRRSAQTSARNVAVEFSAVRRRATLSAFQLMQRARNSSWPDRLRAGSRNASAEFSSVFKRTVSSASLLAQRARGLRWPNASRDLALAAAILFAFTTVLAYRSRGPAKPPVTSASPNSTAQDLQPQLPKPAPGTDASLASAPAPAAATAHSAPRLKRVQVAPNEVDYIGNDVTIRTFTDRSRAKHPRLAASRTTQFGDDVTVRYFTPQPQPTKTASR